MSSIRHAFQPRLESSPPGAHVLLLAAISCVLLALPPEALGQASGGFLYGRVTTNEDGEYEGFLRWGRQEAFWDDLFHSMKTELPHREEVDAEDLESARRGREGKVEMWGLRIRWSTGERDARRLFIARFGDLDSIEPRGRGKARVTVRGGGVYDVSGYSDDVTSSIRLFLRGGEERELEWDSIDRIEFFAAPSEFAPPSQRLHGTVTTRENQFEGYVMWDKEECLTTDLLDGETRDGDVSIEMGRIHRIERRGSTRSLIELESGRRLKLRGTNDVNGDNRGIQVEVAGTGKVTIPWDEFEAFERDDASGSGATLADYPDASPLHGRVLDVDGRRLAGRLVLDLDEAEDWEMLNGSVGEVSFDIPFRNVARLSPRDEDSCLVELRDGTRLELSGGQDVSILNDGVLVYEAADSDPVYLAWTQIDSIEFDR